MLNNDVFLIDRSCMATKEPSHLAAKYEQMYVLLPLVQWRVQLGIMIWTSGKTLIKVSTYIQIPYIMCVRARRKTEI